MREGSGDSWWRSWFLPGRPGSGSEREPLHRIYGKSTPIGREPRFRMHAVIPSVEPNHRRAGERKRRIVLTTLGSLGDLHPFVALALGFQARGHEAVIATSATYRPKVEAL